MVKIATRPTAPSLMAGYSGTRGVRRQSPLTESRAAKWSARAAAVAPYAFVDPFIDSRERVAA